jgi:hypothetical protein
MKRERDDLAYIAMLRRMIRAAARRLAEADPQELGEFLTLTWELDTAATVAIAGLRRNGVTWEDIGRITGVTRQAALMKWAPRIARASSDGIAAERGRQ